MAPKKKGLRLEELKARLAMDSSDDDEPLVPPGPKAIQKPNPKCRNGV
jgi:hypothetical protein